MSRMKKILKQVFLLELFVPHLLGILASDMTYPGNMRAAAGAETSFSWMPALGVEAGGRTECLPAAVQGSHHRQCFGLSKQPVRVQLHSSDSLKNEHCSCSLEFLSLFPGTFSPYMQTHLSEKLQETSYLLGKLWMQQASLFNASVRMSRKDNEGETEKGNNSQF